MANRAALMEATLRVISKGYYPQREQQALATRILTEIARRRRKRTMRRKHRR